MPKAPLNLSILSNTYPYAAYAYRISCSVVDVIGNQLCMGLVTSLYIYLQLRNTSTYVYMKGEAK